MQNLLQEFSESERTAYLGAIASIATADHSSTEEEIEFLKAMIQTSGVSPEAEAEILAAAKEENPSRLKDWIEQLKHSELKYSLVADLIAFAASDNDYSEEEKQSIKKIAAALNISNEQYGLLNQFVAEAENLPTTALTQPDRALGFFENSGLGNQLSNAGINMGSLSKGLLGVIAPLLLTKLLSGSKKSSGGGLGDLISGLGGKKSSGGLGDLISGLGSSGAGGGMGDLLGGLLGSSSGGSIGDLLGGKGGKKGGGLGDLISGLGGNKGFGSSGKLLESLFK